MKVSGGSSSLVNMLNCRGECASPVTEADTCLSTCVSQLSCVKEIENFTISGDIDRADDQF